MINNILVVDDIDINVELLRDLLESHGYGVFTASRGKQVLNIISREKVDLILLYLQMPEMDGIEVLSAIHNDDKYANILVIMLSGNFESEDIYLALKNGAKDFINKPFSFAELIKKINNYLPKN